MSIPDRLKLKPVDQKLLKEMFDLCDAIERELESGEAAEHLLQQWHAQARRKCEPYEFEKYWKSESRKTFVLSALNPDPSFDEDAVYSEVRDVLGAISEAKLPESQHQYYLRWLEVQFPGAKVSDLIYWPDEWFDDASLVRHSNGVFKPESELSSDQIVGYLMAKSGRRLVGSPEDVTLPFPVPKS
ncbi:MAG: hypothetical protein K2X38_09550 [Gemmataceae bacterium]|nr:hypothetical protein [Gemmataceae bacterium]